MVTFKTELELGGKNATGVRVPGEVVLSLGSSKRPAVKVTINDYTYHSTVASMDGVFMIPVSADVREHAGVKAGDWIEVGVELDTEPREVIVPRDLAAALHADEPARIFFEQLSYSNRRRIVLSIEDAKTEETRQRRILKAIESLRAGRV